MTLPPPALRPGPEAICFPLVRRAFAFGAASLLLHGASHAAPLDAILSAMPELEQSSSFLELATDQMNLELDIFRVRESDPETIGTAAGDYHGYHLAGAIRATQGLWVSGSLWRRTLSSATDTFSYDSYVIATQYRILESLGNHPALAVRASAWGNQAAATESSAPVNVPGAILNTVRVTTPADRSVQLDLIGTWAIPNRPILSAGFGVGTTQLSYGGLTATTTRNGCEYDLQFNGNDIYGTLAQNCNTTGGVIQQFYDSSGAYGVDVAAEIAWKSRFWQVGGNAFWRGDPWSFKVGYLFHKVQREVVDNILANRDKPHYAQNHTALLETIYRLQPHWQVFGRAQLSSNLLFSEIPVTYNTSTSERFASKYSLFTIGTRWDF